MNNEILLEEHTCLIVSQIGFNIDIVEHWNRHLYVHETKTQVLLLVYLCRDIIAVNKKVFWLAICVC